MDDSTTKMSSGLHDKRTRALEAFSSGIDFFLQIRQSFQNCVTSHFGGSIQIKRKVAPESNAMLEATAFDTAWAIDLEKQLRLWHENPYWVEQPPQLKVSVPKGSLCNLNVKFQVGLPPDAIYDIVIDPNNKRVFKNIKEVISRRVLMDEGLRQVVEVEQAAIWRFLWFSGTIAVHVIVDQNRAHHSVNFKQGREGFMKKFEGCWKVEPLFVDEGLCLPAKPKTLAEYNLCTGGRGRVGSVVSLEQLVQPALLPPPPISWYLRGITTGTTEMMINDLLAEAARLRGSVACDNLSEENHIIDTVLLNRCSVDGPAEIKGRWKDIRKSKRRNKIDLR